LIQDFAMPQTAKTKKYTISVIVENQFGVLARISGLISARAFNIDSLTVSATEDPTVSHMTIVVDADQQKLEQVKRQLGRLVDVIKVRELSDKDFIGRDLLLARVQATGAVKARLKKRLSKFGARIADENGRNIVIEATGRSKALDDLVEELRRFKLTRLVRAGRVALER